MPAACERTLLRNAKSGREILPQPYGAELRVHNNTHLELAVARPPTSIDDAFDVAWCHYMMAGEGLSDACMSVREHARALLYSHDWVLMQGP